MLHLDAPESLDGGGMQSLLLNSSTSTLAQFTRHYPAGDGTCLEEAREECDQVEVIGWM